MSRIQSWRNRRLVGMVMLFTALLMVFPSGALASQGEDVPVLDLIGLLNRNDPGLPVPDGAVGVGVPQGIEWDVSVKTIAAPQLIPEDCDIRFPETCLPPLTMSMSVHPEECTHYSFNPHKAYTEPGWVHARGKIECEYSKSLYIEGSLTRDRWYGEQHLHSSSTTKTATWHQLINRWQCTGGTYTYHLYNYSSATGPQGKQWGYTGNSNRFNCP